MESNSLSNKRIVDFDPPKCGIDKDHVLLFSPLDFIEEHNLYIPEKIQMPDGTINESVVFDSWSFSKALEEWEGDFLSMYVGKNYLQTIDKWAKGYITDREKVISLYLPKVINIFLYDNEIDG